MINFVIRDNVERNPILLSDHRFRGIPVIDKWVTPRSALDLALTKEGTVERNEIFNAEIKTREDAARNKNLGVLAVIAVFLI